jgi:magnesium transporter
MESLITSKVPICYSNQKITAVKKYFNKNVSKFDTVNYIYVLTKNNRLKGVISIQELFSSPPSSYIREHMAKKVIKAHVNTDQEKIAHLALKTKIKSIPIVEKNNEFVGIIPSEIIFSILDSESNEDFLHLSGIIPHEKPQNEISIFESFFNRTPWIIVGLFGGLIAAGFINHFEKLLEKEVILAAFIPLIVYVANAVGIQTQTLYIRDLAVSHNVAFINYSIKQLIISTLIGIICWITILGISLLFWKSVYLGMIVGLSVLGGIIAATVFAMVIPFILLKLNKDPAIGSGPFTTIIQDILSIIIYFLIAYMFIM